ncbi:MAG: hypothetical protein COA52_01045 [Hyphomicrobiales bacterium]|nr:MAG: hypothetical protein COA52_01045 [Hyphomicrobiales bacterium]
MKQINEGIIKDGANIFLLYSFIKKLVLKFEEWPAYKRGFIDKNGKILKHRKDMTLDEKRDLSLFDIMIMNLKKLLAKVPGGSSRIATFGAALFLLREGQHMSEEEIEKSLLNMGAIFESYMTEAKILMEDAPANNMGDGAIAHINGPETILGNKKKKRKKKDELQTIFRRR